MSATLTEIFSSNRHSLIGLVLRIVKDRQVAEDLTQEAYIRAYRASEGGPIVNVAAFLRQTARNLAIDYRRRQRSRERFEDRNAGEATIEAVAADTVSAEDALIEKERFRRFAEALDSLPERAKKAWKLSQIDGWTYDRVARHLGVSRNTVYNDVKLVMGHCHDVLKRLENG
ncbi:sigma-70 family RNA polymerase sigma factor [Oricola sp.]|uniref:RNA polymerase sigma factor n=1 Tax=Oricola sp. TaxID=1979950 RepID=UPI0025E24C77|nr:sigma-70 family RNA polymerase sigma factor [Oricola sp.]